jgi:predicted O-linked N-acetylglucosamine transferase (SPINDLY family)
MKEYEALAIELALNRGKLLSIQEKLRKNRLTTPLFDTAQPCAAVANRRQRLSK